MHLIDLWAEHYFETLQFCLFSIFGVHRENFKLSMLVIIYLNTFGSIGHGSGRPALCQHISCGAVDSTVFEAVIVDVHYLIDIFH